MASSILEIPLLINILVCLYIRKQAGKGVSNRATLSLIGLIGVFVLIYLARPIGLTVAEANLTAAIPDFIEANFMWGGWVLTEAWLTAAIFDGVYSFSKTELPYVQEFRFWLHVMVGIGFVLLTYSYFAPFINKILASNQTRAANQTRTT